MTGEALRIPARCKDRRRIVQRQHRLQGSSLVLSPRIVCLADSLDDPVAQIVDPPGAPGPVPPAAMRLLSPLVEKAALVQAINDAWALVAILTLAALLCVPFARSRTKVL